MENLFKHKLILATIAIQLVALPLILFVVKQQQRTTTKATAGTTLFFSPTTTTASPLAVNVGQDFSVDVMVNPTTNLISLAKIDIKYDSSRMTLSPTNPVVINSQAFPTIVEGPIYSQGSIKIVVSIGSDQTKVIQAQTKILTLNFKATAAVNPTSIDFQTNGNALYSIAPQDSSNENVLSTTTPATIRINAAPTPTAQSSPTLTPTPTPSPLPTPTPTPRPTLTPTPTPTPTITPNPTSTLTPSKTTISLRNIKLHGIGKGGDTPNPNSVSTTTVLHTSRALSVELYNTSGTLLNTISGNITFSNSSGDFSGDVDVPSTVANANYIIKIKSPQYLRRQLPGFLSLVQGQVNIPTSASLITGDVNGDNALSVADYDLIMDCYADLLPAKSCDATKKVSTDLSDDGKVNHNDYNLFLRELSVQQGD